METDLEKFWQIYDEYIRTEDESLRQQLSFLLLKVEKPSRREQLFRPEKGWNEIVAWQVLRTQQFIYPRNTSFLYGGVIFSWTPHWDRDHYLTRIPCDENVSGYIIRPGFYRELDQKEMNDEEWHKFVENHIFADERGLYLPLYENETVIKLAFSKIEEAKSVVIDHLKKEKGYK